MSTDELIALFNKHEDEFLKDAGIPGRRDLYAFNLLAELAPAGPRDKRIISAAEHDEIFLAPSLEELAIVITEEQVITLLRCGVHLDDEDSGLAMFA